MVSASRRSVPTVASVSSGSLKTSSATRLAGNEPPHCLFTWESTASSVPTTSLRLVMTSSVTPGPS